MRFRGNLLFLKVEMDFLTLCESVKPLFYRPYFRLFILKRCTIVGDDDAGH